MLFAKVKYIVGATAPTIYSGPRPAFDYNANVVPCCRGPRAFRGAASSNGSYSLAILAPSGAF